MKASKKVGLFMDHSRAHCIAFSDEVKKATTVVLDFDQQDKDETLQRSESEMHNKQQQRQHDYYKKLAAIIKDCSEVVLFGPTDAKVEFYNFLRKDHSFDALKIEVLTTDKMTENQQHEFVRTYFKKFEIKTL